MSGKNDTEMLWRQIRHILSRGRRTGQIKPGMEAAAKVFEELFGDLASEESAGVDSRAILRDLLDEMDEEDCDD